SQGFYGVRLSFLLGDIQRLGSVYPPALDALKERRDKARKAILEGEGGFQAAHDFQALAQHLGEPDAALELYDELGKKDKEKYESVRRDLGRLVFEKLVAAKRYKDAVEAKGDPAQAMDPEFTGYEAMKNYDSALPKDQVKEMREFQKKHL